MSMQRLFFYGAFFLYAAVACRGDAAAAGGLQCAPCGYGGGGRFTALAADPRDPQTVLAGSDVAGVFKSTDGGGHFALKGRGLGGFAVSAIAFHPVEPGSVYLLTDDGLYLSTDAAESWRMISSAVFYKERFFGSCLLLFFENALWAGTDAGGVFRISLDRPAPAVASVPGLAGVKVNCLAVHGGRLHAATSRGMYRLDEGRWHDIGTGLPGGAADMTDMAAHPGGRLYAVEKKTGLYLRDDRAESWMPVASDYAGGLSGTPEFFKAVALHPDDPDHVFLATHPDAWPFLLLESSNGGRSWKKTDNFTMDAGSPLSWRTPPDAVESVLISPAHPERMYVADWWNLWRSTDGGRHWRQLTQGLQNFVVNDIKQHPNEKDTLFMAVADNGLVKSVDGGRSWKRIMSGVENGHGIELELSRRDPQTMYLLMQPWITQDRVLVYKTRDGGATWADAGFSIKGLARQQLPFVDGLATNLEIDPSSDDIVYVATNGYGVFKTVSGGRQWTAVNNGLAEPNIKGPDALLVHPLQPQTLFASTQSGGIYKTTDGGQSWKHVSTGGYFTFGMAIDRSNPSRIIAGCAEKKLLISHDGGMTWKERALPGDAPAHIAAYAVAIDPVQPQKVYAGTLAYGCLAADGLYASADGGATFAGIALELPLVSINDIAVLSGAQQNVLLGFNGIGLYCAGPRR